MKMAKMLAGTRQFEQTWCQREDDLKQWVKCWKGVTEAAQMSCSFVKGALSFNSRTYNNVKCHDFVEDRIINFLSKHRHHGSLN